MKALTSTLFGAWIGLILGVVFHFYYYDWRFWLILIPAVIFFTLGDS